MKKILIALALLVSLNSPADVLIYKNKITVTRTGGGFVTKAKISGFSAFDTDGGFVIAYADDARRNFSLVKSERVEWVAAGLNGGANKDLFAVSIRGGLLNGFFARGVNKPLPGVIAPLTFNVTGGDVFQLAGGDAWFQDEWRGVLTFDKANTTASAGDSLETVTRDLRAYFLNLGYLGE